MARRAVRLRGSRASCFPHSDTEMFAVVFKLSAYKLSERLRPATVADVSEGRHVFVLFRQVCRGYVDPHGDPHGYGCGVGMAIEIPSPRQPCVSAIGNESVPKIIINDTMIFSA